MRLAPIILRMPKLIYGLAVLFFIWSFALSYFDLQSATAYADPENSAVRLMMLRALYQAALEAAYIALNGVIVQILLAIWHNGGVSTRRGDEK